MKLRKYININNQRLCQIVDYTSNPNYVIVYYIGTGQWGLQGCLSQPEHETVLRDHLVEF